MADDKEKGKGKGKSPATNDQIPDQNTVSPPILSRVTASASGLARSTFSPATNELNEQAAAALSSGGKGRSSTSNVVGSSSWAESSRPPSNFPQASKANALKPGHTEAHLIRSENDFSDFLDGIDSFLPTSESAVQAQAGDSENNGFGDAWARAHIGPQPTLPFLTVDEQESQDGRGVLDLLSGPLAVDEEFEPPPDGDENYDWGLSEEQLARLRAIAPEPKTVVSPDNQLNLVPVFENMSVEERIAWREQWEGVLTRYADEVWGGMLPLVKEARIEIEEMEREPEVKEQPKALRRLGAILSHLQKR